MGTYGGIPVEGTVGPVVIQAIDHEIEALGVEDFLGLDSLSILAVVCHIEDMLDISIPIGSLDTAQTPKDLYTIVHEAFYKAYPGLTE